MDLKVDQRAWGEAVSRLLGSSKKAPEVVLRTEMRLVITSLADITPPGSEGVRGAAARKQGQASIRGDVLGTGGRGGIFAIVDDKLLRGQAKQQGDKTRLWVSKQGRIYATETTLYRPQASVSEMHSHHKRHYKNGRMASSRPYSKDLGRFRFIDRMVVGKRAWREYERFLFERIFWLSAGWETAAVQLGVRLPAAISKHDAPGAFDYTSKNGLFRMRATNAVSYASNMKDIERRMQWVLDNRRDILDRKWAEFMKVQARKAGFKS